MDKGLQCWRQCLVGDGEGEGDGDGDEDGKDGDGDGDDEAMEKKSKAKDDDVSKKIKVPFSAPYRALFNTFKVLYNAIIAHHIASS